MASFMQFLPVAALLNVPIITAGCSCGRIACMHSFTENVCVLRALWESVGSPADSAGPVREHETGGLKFNQTHWTVVSLFISCMHCSP